MKFCLKILCITLCLALGAAALAGCSSQSAPASSGSAASVSGTGQRPTSQACSSTEKEQRQTPCLNSTGKKFRSIYTAIFFSRSATALPVRTPATGRI